MLRSVLSSPPFAGAGCARCFREHDPFRNSIWPFVLLEVPLPYTVPSMVRKLADTEIRGRLPRNGQFNSRRPHTLIEFKGCLIALLERGVLIFLAQKTTTDGQGLDFGSHEAAKGILRRADNGLASHVEAGIDNHRAPRARAEPVDQLVI